jgi:hypothetical protein
MYLISHQLYNVYLTVVMVLLSQKDSFRCWIESLDTLLTHAEGSTCIVKIAVGQIG